MTGELSPGDNVQSATRRARCTVKRRLGGGGQGNVYLVDIFGRDFALKWYAPAYLRTDPLLRGRLNQMVAKGAPSANFVWPSELAERAGDPTFGYIMPLYEARFHGMWDYIKGSVQIGFRELINIGLNLTEALRCLHAKGLCYRDISFGNLGFDPKNGDVCIWDNDNVGVADQPIGVGGTKGFIAPEVGRGHANLSAVSDLHGLAAMLFQMFVKEHPLEGKLDADVQIFDDQVYRRLHIDEPLFIFDPVDRRNAAVPGWNDNGLVLWPIYPQFLRDLFTRAFTAGLHNPRGGRVTVGEWSRAMVRLHDCLAPCPYCRADVFVDPAARTAEGKPVLQCWHCHRTSAPPPRLHVRGHVVMLNHDAELYAHHIDNHASCGFSQVVARVVRHPTDKQKTGLRNESGVAWSVVGQQQAMVTVDNGRTVALAKGARINFGRVEGEIRE
jgi:DNA-binding helix-hairpin-helix protein with protein kinase domain